jgi:hypothetical protein
LYGVLLAALADDLEAGGVTAQICRGYEHAPREAATQLRLLAGLFRIVLRGDAPQLERFYPNLGGTADPNDAWPLVRAVLEAHVDELHDALAAPPQTNETGRSACLAVGLFEAVRRSGLRRIRLLELGASAGLILSVDRYRFVGADWSWGPPDSPLVLDVGAAGAQPEKLTVLARRGCDLAPVDASTPDGARYLTSFVWPFDLDRHQRLAAALTVVRTHPVSVDQAAASDWLPRQLDQPLPPDVLTVVWQSITEQYWPAAESARVRQIVADARTRIPLAHVAMEGVPPRQSTGGYTVASDGPVTTLDGTPIARSHHHGPPVILLPTS